MKKMIMSLAVCLIALDPTSYAQHARPSEGWDWLVGEWVGEGSGTPGEGTGWFSFQPGLAGKIMIRKGHSQYPATKDNPEVIHDDLMIVYGVDSDSSARAIYFDNEGHVINYNVNHTGAATVFTSDRTERAPVYRLSYIPLDTETVDVKFEMSRDGRDFTTYVEGKSRRKK